MTLRKLTALAALLACTGAHAGLLGETVGYQRLGPNIATPAGDFANGNYVVGDGVEVLAAFENRLQVDIGDNQLSLSFKNLSFSTVPFAGFRIEDVLNQIEEFTTFTVDPASTVNFAPSRLSFDADHLWVNLAGASFLNGDRLVLRFTTGYEGLPDPSPVPEPASAALLLLGLGVLGAQRRRRKV